MNSYYIKNRERILKQQREYHKKWHILHREEQIRKNTEWVKSHREELNIKIREKYNTDPHWKIRRKANDAVNYAIRQGEIRRGMCEICGKKAEAHHCNYGKPLDVMWLCKEHHIEWHKNNKPIYPKNT